MPETEELCPEAAVPLSAPCLDTRFDEAEECGRQGVELTTVFRSLMQTTTSFVDATSMKPHRSKMLLILARRVDSKFRAFRKEI